MGAIASTLWSIAKGYAPPSRKQGNRALKGRETAAR